MIDTNKIDAEEAMNELYRKFYNAANEARDQRERFYQDFNGMREILETHFPRFKKGGVSDLSVMDDLFILETFLKTYSTAERIAKNGR